MGISENFAKLRIGQGYDSHCLVDGIPLYIGGALIESPFGSKGHSDGDCLLHSITDSILGALGLGDIGRWFPDNDPSIKGIRSTEILKQILSSERLPAMEIVNVDMTLFLNKPKMSPHADRILASISSCIGVDTSRLNLKAKTWEGQEDRATTIASSATTLIVLS